MSSSLFLYHSATGVILGVLLLALVALPLTLVASALLLWLYRRSVAKLTSAQAGEIARSQVSGGTLLENSTRLLFDKADAARSEPTLRLDEVGYAERLYGLAISEPRRHACKYACAGALFALVTSLSAVFALSQPQINYLRAADHPFQVLFMFWTCFWPAVMTTNLVAGSNRRRKRNQVVAYMAVLVALSMLFGLTPSEPSFRGGNLTLSAWSGESPLHLGYKWILFNIPPTLLTLMFRHRRVRAVAPLVLSFMTVVSAGLLGTLAMAYFYLETSVAVMVFMVETLGLSIRASVIGFFLLICVTAVLFYTVLGWRLLLWIRDGYLRKSLSDQSLPIDALWLMFACFYAVILAVGGPGWAFCALGAFLVFKIAVGIGNKALWPKSRDGGTDPALLVLRVFSLGKRSESLFNVVTGHWRYVGNVRLIAGTDLALSTVAPHRFLAFVSGKLKQSFVGSDDALERNLAGLDTERDVDGRFRIGEFFCYADTWQAVLMRLVKSTDVVFMDLRNFARNHAGCVFEIKELLNNVALERLVFVADKTTDIPFLNETLEESYRNLDPESPNGDTPLSNLQLFEFQSGKYGEIEKLMKKLCAAAAFQHTGSSKERGLVI